MTLKAELKAEEGPGQWLAYLAEYIGYSPRKAQRYMEIADEWPEAVEFAIQEGILESELELMSEHALRDFITKMKAVKQGKEPKEPDRAGFWTGPPPGADEIQLKLWREFQKRAAKVLAEIDSIKHSYPVPMVEQWLVRYLWGFMRDWEDIIYKPQTEAWAKAREARRQWEEKPLAKKNQLTGQVDDPDGWVEAEFGKPAKVTEDDGEDDL